MLSRVMEHPSRVRGLRAGYSLVELMVAIVILGIVAGAATRMLSTQTQFFDKRANVRDARAVTQSALNVIESELRMVQDTMGVAAVAADGSSITVRVPYLVGVVCATGAVTTVAMVPADSSVYTTATFGGYAYRTNNIFTSSNYVSTASGASAVTSTNASCISSTGLKSFTVAGRSLLKYDLSPAIPGTSVGSAVMFWQLVKYQFKTSTAYPSYLGLYRQVGSNTAEELLAPFKTGSKFQFYFGPAAGGTVSTTSQSSVSTGDTLRIKGVDIVLIGSSQKKLAGSDTTAASKNTTAVFFHNHWQ